MSRAKGWPVAIATTLAGATLVLAAAALWSLSRPLAGEVGDVTLGLSGGLHRSALRRLGGTPDSAALRAAAADASRALTLSPYDNSARLTLAYIDTRRDGALHADGVALLSQSYDLAPYDHAVAAWRVRFALEHWSALSPADREAVRAEAMAFSTAGSHDLDIPAVLRSIDDPSGRLAAALWLRALQH